MAHLKRLYRRNWKMIDWAMIDTFKRENWGCKKAVKWFIEKSSTSEDVRVGFILNIKGMIQAFYSMIADVADMSW